jgi:5'(3')-deoxyribonucleotidase
MAKAMEINEGDEFWRPIHALGEKFWIDLEPLPWAKALIELVEQYSKDWHVVSSPSQLVESYTGKVKWLKWFFGQSFDRFALTPHKHVFACHNVILIDDREQNIHDFTGSGGYGIVFPTLHNNRWPFADDSLHYVKDRLETICGPR